MRVRAAALGGLAALALLVAGCGSGSDGAAASSSAAPSSASSSGSASEAPTPGPAVPAATKVAAAVPADQLPTVSGKFGEKPTFTWPKTLPPPSLQRTVLSEGTGAEVKSGDYLIANYEGIVWGSDKPFDNSYDRKKTSSFQIGRGKVVSGWDVSLVGVKLGSRVLLSLPPADGYGSAGNSQAGIKGTDTIVFVVDLVDALPSDKGGQTDVKQLALGKNLPEVTGKLGEKPTVTIPKGLAAPTKTSVTDISVGTGAKIQENDQVLVQYELTTWDGSQKQGTWPVAKPTTPDDAQRTGLTAIPIQKGTPFESLIGKTIGSRVLLTTAATNSAQGATPALAVVVDLVAES